MYDTCRVFFIFYFFGALQHLRVRPTFEYRDTGSVDRDRDNNLFFYFSPFFSWDVSSVGLFFSYWFFFVLFVYRAGLGVPLDWRDHERSRYGLAFIPRMLQRDTGRV